MHKTLAQKIFVNLFSINVRMVCLLFLGLSGKLVADENVPFVFAEGEIIRADEINQNYQSLLERLIEVEGRLAELEQDSGIQGNYVGIGAGSRFKSIQDGAFIHELLESHIWSEIVITEDLILYGLEEIQYATLQNSNPANQLSLEKDTETIDNLNNEADESYTIKFSLVVGSGGVGSVYQGEITALDDGEAEVLTSLSFKLYRASKDILVYQVQYLADSAADLADTGLGYEQGVFIRSTDDL
ncbi:hypothetical protein N9I66_09510 [Pseudomonadales bacterium]|nr:hypothetical protein [Pseudomonadales bacterium]